MGVAVEAAVPMATLLSNPTTLLPTARHKKKNSARSSGRRGRCHGGGVGSCSWGSVYCYAVFCYTVGGVSPCRPFSGPSCRAFSGFSFGFRGRSLAALTPSRPTCPRADACGQPLRSLDSLRGLAPPTVGARSRGTGGSPPGRQRARKLPWRHPALPPLRQPTIPRSLGSPRHRCAVPAGAPLGGGAWFGRSAPSALAASPCPERRVRGSPRMSPLGAAFPPQAQRAWRQLASVACVGARASCGLRQSSSLSPHPARPPAPPAAGGSPGGLPLAGRVLPCRAARVNRPRPARGSCALTRAPPSAGLVSGVLRPACGGLPSSASVLSPGLRPVVARRPTGG